MEDGITFASGSTADWLEAVGLCWYVRTLAPRGWFGGSWRSRYVPVALDPNGTRKLGPVRTAPAGLLVWEGKECRKYEDAWRAMADEITRRISEREGLER